MVFLHGGGYFAGPDRGHWAWLTEVQRRTGSAGAMVLYRMPPRHPFPTALDDALAAIRSLLADGRITDGRWILGGDSAGGGLALAVAQAIRDAGDPLPAGILLTAPWVDVEMEQPEVLAEQREELVVGRSILRWGAERYAAGVPLDDPRISPINASVHGLPPVHLNVGTEDLFLHDDRRLRTALVAAGVPVTSIEQDGRGPRLPPPDHHTGGGVGHPVAGDVDPGTTEQPRRAPERGHRMTTTNRDRQPYQDPQLPIDQRISDLLARMPLEDKAGLMFHAVVSPGPLDAPNPMIPKPSPQEMLEQRRLTHFNLLGAATDGRELAQWHNALQAMAAAQPLQIPVTLSTDPRHHFTDNPMLAILAGPFSQWPEPLGLAAIRSEELMEEFAAIAREEYVAVGLRVALHPQIDLATEPRWPRIAQTFGEDADLTGRLAAAYIRGFQGEAVGPDSVATMTKHFPGGGPQKDGTDPHFSWGREQVYPGGRFGYHLEPFLAALDAGTSQMMPYYGMPVGTEHEEVGFSFNRSVITGLLREQLAFDGIVCTDWGLITDVPDAGELGTRGPGGSSTSTPTTGCSSSSMPASTRWVASTAVTVSSPS